jgi:hypothetical protein
MEQIQPAKRARVLNHPPHGILRRGNRLQLRHALLVKKELKHAAMEFPNDDWPTPKTSIEEMMSGQAVMIEKGGHWNIRQPKTIRFRD